jgi:hypothetical protein
MWFVNGKAVAITVALIFFLGLSARSEEDADSTQKIDSPQTQGKSCLSLCLEDGEDMLTCADYCTMVADFSPMYDQSCPVTATRVLPNGRL